jgi:hypothetical protein
MSAFTEDLEDCRAAGITVVSQARFDQMLELLRWFVHWAAIRTGNAPLQPAVPR